MPSPSPPQEAAAAAEDQIAHAPAEAAGEAAVAPIGLADIMEQAALNMKEPELTPADLVGAPAVVATHSVEQNPPPIDDSQHARFPGVGDEGEELPVPKVKRQSNMNHPLHHRWPSIVHCSSMKGCKGSGVQQSSAWGHPSM
eukprot:5572005-Karenia_brevis.AAC.1